MKRKDKILMITYFFGTKGCAPAEWADDKIDALNQLDKDIILVTSIFSKKNMKKNITHYRIPSLSIQDLKHELFEMKNENMKIQYIKWLFFLPFIITIGLGLDLLQKIITSGNGGGKWSWTIPVSIIGLYLQIRYNCKIIFTTGGPAGAHLSGVFLKKFFKKTLICELQDPLSGEEIGRTVNSAKLLNIVERIIVKNADKVVFTTKSAVNHIKNKYVGVNIANIENVYPGCKDYKKYFGNNCKKFNKLRMIHLGTLYSTRNFHTLIQAIDELLKEKKINENQIEILNLGEIYGDFKEHHLSRKYVKQESIRPREEAISIASTFDVFLLIQHSDNRSKITIPYKTYDYLALDKPILALTNSDELRDLICEYGHTSITINEVEKIKYILIELLNNYDYFYNKIEVSKLNFVNQTESIFN